MGNRTAKTNQLNAVTESYGYDAIYQLTGVTQGANTTESYSYDPVGNRLSSLGVSPYSYNNSNQLTSTPSATYTYDNNGNTLTKTIGMDVTSYAWDYDNRLTQVTLPGGVVSFKYDPLGRRIQKSSAVGTTNYAYDGADIAEEVDASGAAIARYANGPGIDEPLAMLRGGATSYYQADGLGSVTSLTDSSASFVATYSSDTYGKLTVATGTAVNPLRYTGREFDSETGLDYYRARYYDPAIGRFISEDPIGFKGGRNFYVYVRNSPASRIDPMGLWSPAAHDALIAHALGACGVPDWIIGRIQQNSRDWDEDSQDVNQANYHSMAKPGQSAQEAMEARNQIVADYLNRATLAYHHGTNADAFWDFAVAIHALMDMTSPAHTDSKGNPIMWCGVGGCPGNRGNVRQHTGPGDLQGIERKRDITPAIYSLNDEAIRSAYEYMTGLKLKCQCK